MIIKYSNYNVIREFDFGQITKASFNRVCAQCMCKRKITMVSLNKAFSFAQIFLKSANINFINLFAFNFLKLLLRGRANESRVAS